MEGSKKKTKVLEDLDVPICRLCLKIVSNNGFQPLKNITRELQCILPNLNYNFTPDPIMCRKCKETLHRSVRFKTVCLKTDVYLKNLRTDDEQLFNDIFTHNSEERPEEGKCRTCRFCLRLIDDNSCIQLTTLEYMLQKCLPEVDLKLTQSPVICGLCTEELQNHMSFFMFCLDIEDKVKHYFTAHGGECASLRDMLSLSIKMEAEKDNCVDDMSNEITIVKHELQDHDDIKIDKDDLLNIKEPPDDLKKIGENICNSDISGIKEEYPNDFTQINKDIFSNGVSSVKNKPPDAPVAAVNKDDSSNDLSNIKKEAPHDDYADVNIRIKHEEVSIKEENEETVDALENEYTCGEKTYGAFLEDNTLRKKLPHILDHDYVRIQYPVSKGFLALLQRYRNSDKRYVPRSKLMCKRIKFVKKNIRQLEKIVTRYQKMVQQKLEKLNSLSDVIDDLKKRNMLSDDILKILMGCKNIKGSP